MTDERFERDLTAVLRDIAGDEAPSSLRYRLRTVTASPTAGRRSWFAPLVQLSAAAVVAVAVAALGWTFVLPAIVGLNATPTPGPSSSVPVPSGSPSQVPSPSPSGTPVTSGWTGLDWSDPVVASAEDGLRIRDIVPWAGGYVAVGDTAISDSLPTQGAFLASTNGVDWTVVQTVDLRREGERMTHVFLIGGRLLATAEGGSVSCPADTTCPTPDFTPELWTSTDGSRWSAVASPTWDAAWSNAGTARWIVAGDAGILAIGVEGQGVREAGQPMLPPILVAFHSEDGMAWEQADLTEGFDRAVFMDAAAFSGGFVIVGRDGEPDTLSEVVDPSNPIPLGLGRPAAWVSADGINWTAAQVDGIEIEGGELSAVNAGADGLFAIGAGSPDAGDATPSGWSSVDGRTWHVAGRLGAELPAIDPGVHQPGYTVLASDGRHIVVLDRDAPGSDTLAAWVSSDGATWTRLALSGSTPLPKIGNYGASGAQGMYVTGAWVLPDRIVVTGFGGGAYGLWFATAVGS